MAKAGPQSLSAARMALLGTYVALERGSSRKYTLESDLHALGIDFGESLDAYSQLEMVATSMDEPGRPRLHWLPVAFAAMEVLRRDTTPEDSRERLRPITEMLVDRTKPSPRDGTDPADAVHSALERAVRSAIPARQRWEQVNSEVSEFLIPELAAIKKAWCESELRSVDDEAVSRVQTNIVVESSRSIQQIAPAAFPQNWSQCNDFFCSLTRRSDRDPPRATGGIPSPGSPNWCGAYEEKVGGCPDGWFPDTFLIFDWYRSDSQLVLRYDLTPRRGGDATVLKIDQGYLQVNRLRTTYDVSTVKYLLLDDKTVPGGGQALGSSACQLGWLDYSINQFTECAAALDPTGDDPGNTGRGSEGEPGSRLDAGLQRVLSGCEDHLRESATSADAQLREILKKVRRGRYGLNDFVGDWGRAVACGMREGARTLEGQINYAAVSLELANRLIGGRNTKS